MTETFAPTLAVQTSDDALVEEIGEVLANHGSRSDGLSARAFSGGEFTRQILIPLLPVVTASVTTVIVAAIRARRHVSVRLAGVELTGLSPKHIESVLHLAATKGDALAALEAINPSTEPPEDDSTTAK